MAKRKPYAYFCRWRSRDPEMIFLDPNLSILILSRDCRTMAIKYCNANWYVPMLGHEPVRQHYPSIDLKHFFSVLN